MRFLYRVPHTSLFVAVLLCCSLSAAQYNAVYNSSGTIVPSAAFVDASVSTFANADFCAQIYNALAFVQGLSPQPASVVIDAHGIVLSSASCASGSTPWAQKGKTSITLPSTIFLPSGQITINEPWVIPNMTKVIGMGKTQTNIVAGSCFTAGGTGCNPTQFMLEMCASTCNGVGISDLKLSGGGFASFIGILNSFAQQGSYVQHVTINQVEKYGIEIDSGASNSGPYFDLNITEGGTNCGTTCQETSSTLCIYINGTSTRGIHGLTCTGNGTPNAGISLNGNSNTIDEIHFEGVVDGIRIGDVSASAGNVISNITGATGGGKGTSGVQHNVIHICGSHPANSLYVCTGQTNLVTDLSILQVKQDTAAQNALLDDVNGVELGGATGNDSVSSYFRGQQALTTGGTNYGSSNITTSTSTGSTPTPTPYWGEADLGASGGPSTPCATGSIFSNTTGTSPSSSSQHVVWVCTGGSWTAAK